MPHWLDDVRRLEDERDAQARAQANSNREILEETSLWIQRQVVPAMEQFANDLRSIVRIVEVHVSDMLCRVEVRDRMGIISEHSAEIGTEGDDSTEVRDKLPTTSAVFHGAHRNEVAGDRIYELLKRSSLSKIESRKS